MFRVVLSVGHGYTKNDQGEVIRDLGAVNERFGINEHDLCEEIRTLIVRMCKRLKGVDIICLPSGTLEEKVRRINEEVAPDLAVEIHLNAVGDRNVRGIETLHYPGAAKSKYFASIFLSAMALTAETRNRGLQTRSDLYFLRATSCPAIITEAEFVSNWDVANELKNGIMVPQIAYAHSRALAQLAEDATEE